MRILQHKSWKRNKIDLLTGTSFLKLTPVGLVTVTVFATVVVVEVVTIVLTCPARGAFVGTWAWAWAWARAILPGVVIEPCIFTGGSLDCCPYSIYYRDKERKTHEKNSQKKIFFNYTPLISERLEVIRVLFWFIYPPYSLNHSPKYIIFMCI